MWIKKRVTFSQGNSYSIICNNKRITANFFEDILLRNSMALETSVLSTLKAQLENEKTQLENELNRIAIPTDIPGNYETRFEDLGREDGDSESETQKYVDDLAVEGSLEQNLQSVTDALDRMEKGTYGVCIECGKDIAIERLLAYPSAKNCVSH